MASGKNGEGEIAAMEKKRIGGMTDSRVACMSVVALGQSTQALKHLESIQPGLFLHSPSRAYFSQVSSLPKSLVQGLAGNEGLDEGDPEGQLK